MAANPVHTATAEVLFDQIMTDYGQDILQLTYSYVRNHAIAEDLTQEIFVKCYQSLPSFERRANVKTWLWRIAINHCKDYLKSWHHRNVMIAETEPYLNSARDQVEQTVIRHEEDVELIEAVMALPLKYREPVYLHYFQDLTVKEIETLTGVKQGTLKTRLRRAKELLKNQLKG